MQKNITRKIVGIALFAALSFVLSLLEFPVFPAASFLKLDFSAVFVLLGGFMYGPVAGVIICAVKELIRFIMGSSTGGIGEIANFIVITCLIIVPTVVYRFKKGLTACSYFESARFSLVSPRTLSSFACTCLYLGIPQSIIPKTTTDKIAIVTRKISA